MHACIVKPSCSGRSHASYQNVVGMVSVSLHTSNVGAILCVQVYHREIINTALMEWWSEFNTITNYID